MRAFFKSISVCCKVTNGEEALQMLQKSWKIRRDLDQLKPLCDIEGVQISMSVTKWDSQVPQHPGMNVRGFVYGVSHCFTHCHSYKLMCFDQFPYPSPTPSSYTQCPDNYTIMLLS